MNPKNENPEEKQDAFFEPFPEPNTIPAGWDVSGMYTDPEADGEDVRRAEEAAD